MKIASPYIFDEFFSSGLEESISPFLKKNSTCWAKNLSLKSALLAGLFLIIAFISQYYFINLSYLCLLFVYFLSGTPALLHTIDDLKNLEINIDVLMTLAAFLSFFIGSQMEGGLLLVLFAFSGAMEETVSRKTKGALHNLHNLSPNIGVVIGKEGHLYQKSVREISIGTHLLVKAGEIVPLDGIVINGSSFVNLIHLTGESLPISKQVGNDIQAGSRNLDGTLTICVTKTSAESTLSKVIALMNKAQSTKPKLQRFLDKFSKRYAITIISLFFIFATIIPFLFSIPFFGNNGSVYRALAFLIAASPCALIIATPTAYLSAISACAKNGILLKGGVTLDAFANCKTIAFDKTGTLTTGKLTCIGIESLTKNPKYSIEEAIGIAASLEQNVIHPMAEALCNYTKKQGISYIPITHFQSVPGFGLKGKLNTVEVKIGNAEFIQPTSPLKKQSQMISYLSIGKDLYVFHFLDTIREETKEVLTILKKKQLDLIMLTGDHVESAQTVAQKLGVDHVYSNLRPEHKLEIVSQISKEKALAMIGDGINDAPALTRANVGISMGEIGSATAIDASDIVLLKDDLSLIPWLYKKAHQTIKIVRENLILALTVIFFASTPALLGLIPLWLAVILHEGGTVLVGLNSLRLLKK